MSRAPHGQAGMTPNDRPTKQDDAPIAEDDLSALDLGALPEHVDVAPGGGMSADDPEFLSVEFRIDTQATDRDTTGEPVTGVLTPGMTDAVVWALAADDEAPDDLRETFLAIQTTADDNGINRRDVTADAMDWIKVALAIAAVESDDDTRVPDQLRAHTIDETTEAADSWREAGRSAYAAIQRAPRASALLKRR